MSYKIVKNAAGTLVCFGPNDGMYEPGLGAGETLHIVDELPEPDPADRLSQWRATAECSQMQGILVLGQTNWNKVLTYRATASWSEQIIIDNAGSWHRTSENVKFFGYLLNFTDEQMDTLFRNAAQVLA